MGVLVSTFFVLRQAPKLIIQNLTDRRLFYW